MLSADGPVLTWHGKQLLQGSHLSLQILSSASLSGCAFQRECLPSCSWHSRLADQLLFVDTTACLLHHSHQQPESSHDVVTFAVYRPLWHSPNWPVQHCKHLVGAHTVAVYYC